jgi:hypothetical protein
MGNLALDAFNGAQWTSVSVPAGGDLYDVAQVGNEAYALMTDTIYEASADLSSWKARVSLSPGYPDTRAIVATSAGTVVALLGYYMSSGAGAAIVMQPGAQPGTCAAPHWGQFVAIAPPGSHNVHVFAGAQAGITFEGAHHWVARVDP